MCGNLTPGGLPQAGQLGMGQQQPNMPAYGPGQGPNAMQMMGAPQQSMGPYPGMSGFGPPQSPGLRGGNVLQGPQQMPPQAQGTPQFGMPPPRQAMGGPMGPPISDPQSTGGNFGGLQQYLARLRGQ